MIAEGVTIVTVRDALEAARCRPRPEGGGLRSACPCCQLDGETHNPALKVHERDGRLLIHCHARDCGFEPVLAQLGLTGRKPLSHWATPVRPKRTATRNPLRDQGPEALPDVDQCEQDLYVLGRERFLAEVRLLDSEVLLNHRIGWHRGRSAYVVPLTDARAGFWSYERPVLGVQFYEPKTGQKRMSRGTPAGSILYGQTPRPNDRRLWIVEGELDALCLISNGDPVTGESVGAITGCCGARKGYRPPPEFVEFCRQFAGRLVVAGDNDEAGVGYRDGWSEALRAAGIRHELAVWSGDQGGGEPLPKGYDLTDEVRGAA